jgi:hypothetical protein
VVVQTTGDLVTEEIIDQLLSRRVWMISVAGMDDFHVGMEGGNREALTVRPASYAGLSRPGRARARSHRFARGMKIMVLSLLFRRHTGRLDWQTLAAWAGLDKRSFHGRTQRQFL